MIRPRAAKHTHRDCTPPPVERSVYLDFKDVGRSIIQSNTNTWLQWACRSQQSNNDASLYMGASGKCFFPGYANIVVYYTPSETRIHAWMAR